MMKSLQFQRVLFFLSFLLLSACGVKKDIRVKFETSEPLRVLVLPFVQIEDGEILEEDASIFIDGIPLISDELTENPPELVRQMVQSELSKTGLDVLAPYLVNLELPHHGYARPDGSFALNKIYAASPQQLCSHFVDCDAVLYGWITDWDRSYYGLQTINSVGLKLKLASARSGKSLYEIEVSVDEGRGVSGGPTGFSDLVLEPLKGLDSKNIEKVARRAAEEAITPIYSTARAEYLTAAPPALFAVAHTPLVVKAKPSQSILVLAFAQPGEKMFFSIGDKVKDFPMFEAEPNQYVGEYTPIPGEHFVNETVRASIVDAYGRRTEQVSASGTLTIQ